MIKDIPLMHIIFRLLFASAFIFLLLPLACSPDASADVAVFDDIAPVNAPVRLQALSKGRFFPEGGKLVTFYAGKDKIGTTLSGGDGYAFLTYTPSSPGTYALKAESDGLSDEGTLLVTGEKDHIILIEIETALVDALYLLNPASGAKESLDQLVKSYRIVYLSSLIGAGPSRTWLKDNGFPRSPVLKWGGSEMLDDLAEKGITVYAIIASPAILSEAVDIEKRFSFEEAEDAVKVKDWNDLTEKLR